MTTIRAATTSVLLVACLSITGAGRGAPPVADVPPVSTFPLTQVRLLDGPFKRSEALNLAYVHAIDIDRLLAPFRIEAGLKPKGELYPNWESTGLQGHTAGHYLTALAQAWAATGDAEAKRRLDTMVGELAECQRANGNGYVGAVPKSRQLWESVAAGTLQVERFGLNGAWVPWYNLHKLFAGLRDAYLIGGNAQAREVLVALTDWCAGQRVDVGDHFVHAAVLGPEHLLHLRVRQRREQAAGPVGQRDEHVASLGVAADQVGVAQPGEQLVQVVPGHPRAVQAEALDLQRACGDARPQLTALRHGADVAVAVGELALGQLADHRIQPPLRLGVAGRRPRLRHYLTALAQAWAAVWPCKPVLSQLGYSSPFGFSPASIRNGASSRSMSMAWT